MTSDLATVSGDADSDATRRVLILMGNRKDAERTADVLATAGLKCVTCADAPEMCRLLAEGADALLLTEEAIYADRKRCLPAALATQPPWSSIPIVAIVREGAPTDPRDSILSDFAANITLIERPVRMRTLISVVRAAVRARHHQLETRDAVAELERQRRVYETALSNTADFNYVFDLHGRFVYVNRALLALWRKDLDEAIGKNFFELDYPPELAARLQREIQQVIETQLPLRNVTPYTSAVGERIYEYIFVPVFAPDGSVQAVAGSTRDVTDGLVAQRQLQLVTDHAPVLLVHCDAEARYKFVNKPYADRFGLKPDEIIGRTISEIVGETAYATFKSYVERVLAGEKVSFEVEIPYRDSSQWMRCGYEPEFGTAGEVIGFVGAIANVTDRRRVQQRTEFLLRLEDAVRPLSDPTEITRTYAQLLGEHLGANRCAYADVEEDEDTFNLTGDYCRGVLSIVGQYRFADFGAEALRLMRSDEPYVVSDIDSHFPPPEDFTAYRKTQIQAVICVPLHKGGKFVAAMAVHQTVPRAWRDDEVELVRAVASRSWESIERARALRELHEAGRRKDQFLATLAHELRNPLAPLSNALQAWPLVADDNAKADEMRALMGRQVRQMTRLIDDLLDVSRITRGKIDLRREEFDLRAVIQEAVEGVRPLIESRRHELVLELPAEPLLGVGDRGRLIQVFGNLLHNAAKYSDNEGRLRLSARREGGLAVVEVADNGPGIPQEMLRNIFEMFTQVDETLDRAHGGLGIGLTLAKTLLELHGGSIEAASHGPGKGSVFTAKMPLATTPSKTAAPRLSPYNQHAPLPTYRVLVVDDIKPSASTLALMLNGLGQETRTAYDGITALAALEEFHPELVLSDIAMPGMNGYELARRIREKSSVNPMLVALTGYGQEQDRRMAFEAGFDHHLVKPTSVEALRQLLGRIPSRSRRENRTNRQRQC